MGLFEILLGGGVFMFLAFAVGAAVKRHRAKPKKVPEQPSDFASGIARSMVEDSDSWTYQNDEDWFQSLKAPIAIVVGEKYSNFGQVNTLQPSNHGSRKIVQFEGVDLRTFREAYQVWREKTAVERQMVAEKRKREVLVALRIAA